MANTGRASVLLIPIVAASGFAGLAYEVVWTRMLALTLGTEMMAMLGVVTGFFGGLALGAFAVSCSNRHHGLVPGVGSSGYHPEP